MTGAIIGSAVIGAGASMMGASSQAKSAAAGAAASLQATRESNAQNWKMYEQTRTDQEPWRVAGEKALQNIQDMPDFSFDTEDFFNDPSYDFRMQEGVNALDRSAASRGRVLSGAQDKAVTRYGSNLASTEYGNAYNRAMNEYNTKLAKEQSMAGVGQSATNLVSQAGMNTAAQTGQNTMAGVSSANALNMAGAQATAQGYGGVASSLNQGMGNYLLSQQTKE